MKKDMILLIGDVHAGGDDDAGPNPEGTEIQRWLAKQIEYVYRYGLLQASKYNPYIAFGADLVDLPGFHNRELAGQLLKPFMNLVSDETRVHGVLGTEYHVGSRSVEDIDVMKNHLGIPLSRIAYGWQFDLGGKYIWHSHHGLKIGNLPWNVTDPLYRIAKNQHMTCRFNGEQPPDFIIGHHYHRHAVGTYIHTDQKSTTAFICGAFKKPDGYTHKILQWGAPPSIGAIALYPEGNDQGRTIVPLLSPMPKEYIESW